jgi:hypothetical protein
MLNTPAPEVWRATRRPMGTANTTLTAITSIACVGALVAGALYLRDDGGSTVRPQAAPSRRPDVGGTSAGTLIGAYTSGILPVIAVHPSPERNPQPAVVDGAATFTRPPAQWHGKATRFPNWRRCPQTRPRKSTIVRLLTRFSDGGTTLRSSPSTTRRKIVVECLRIQDRPFWERLLLSKRHDSFDLISMAATTRGVRRIRLPGDLARLASGGSGPCGTSWCWARFGLKDPVDVRIALDLDDDVLLPLCDLRGRVSDKRC